MSHDDTRVNLGKAAPELYRAVMALDGQVVQRAKSAGIADGFSHLLRLRASQINGCAFCLRMHTRDALAAGESSDRVSVLPAWRETQYFSDKERAALQLVEAVTLVAHDQIPETVYAEAAELLSTDEIAAVEWLAIQMNIWNRVAIASRYPVGPEK
ncbi:carboxymuconolactone decarboxylase family protein [Nannocystis sp. SCPEA4]|uniref:carboxymuconolactone decarboxylase family protein n=1 Tax=Nannocystis sp. SCPEA4 TaxID=2996787 RepID=UPI002271C7F3|nr:carboxymuconolactone decarboxylase family protein [Nannocystis sp. SCPEA4]MCY1055329.1 carboxymuconolactone decarboxylase family protein [Nannocystis sp. SCPEA4]